MGNTNKTITARFDGRCAGCLGRFYAGASIMFRTGCSIGHKTWHVECGKADILKGQIQAAELLSLRGDCMMDGQYEARAKKLTAELAQLLATIALRSSTEVRA